MTRRLACAVRYRYGSGKVGNERAGAVRVEWRNPAIAEEQAQGCRYALRCPQAMDRCAASPPFYRTEGDRAVSCYLYADKPVLGSGDLDEVFQERDK